MRGVVRWLWVVMLGVLVHRAAVASPSESCTTFGPLATRGEEGRIAGTLGPFEVSGVAERVEARWAGGEVAWTGPLTSLDPVPLPLPDVEALSQAFADLLRGKVRGGVVRARGLKAVVGSDGVLRGPMRGDLMAWAFGYGGVGVFGGPVPPDAPLSRLPRSLRTGDPFEGHEATPLAALARVVAHHARSIGIPIECGGGVNGRFALAGWGHPIELAAGRRVAWNLGQEALVRGPEGAAWYLVVPMGASQAAELAAELSPLRGARVAWEAGRAAVLVTSDTAQVLPGPGVTPLVGHGSLLALLRPDPASGRAGAAPVLAETLRSPGFDAGVEMVRRLNSVRVGGGLSAVEIDETLTWGAYGHCAWRDANPGLDPSRQVPRTVNFLSEQADRRGGAEEIVRVAPGEAPSASVDALLASPSARATLLNPALRRVGACATPRGTRVIEAEVVRASWEPHVWPPDGASGVPLAFDGVDFALSAADTSGVRSRGTPITVWVNDTPRSIQVLSAEVSSGLRGTVPTILIRPGDGGALIDTAPTVMHVVPREPLDPATDHGWTLRYTLNGVEKVARGRFRTADKPGAAWVALQPLPARILAMVHAKRGRQGNGEVLRPTLAADHAARLVSATGSMAAVRRFRPTSAWFCASPSWYGAWLARGDEAMDATLDPLGLDVRYDEIGFAALRGELCLVLAADPAATPL